MRYGSVCSGIEAATAAWHPLGWRPAFFSEIDPFPRAVLQHHYPNVPLHGDFTTIEAGQYDPIDLLVGGTPCQSFSIAGLRGGLGDDRGNLALEYLKLAARLRPRWLVWENVTGVFSSLSHAAPDPCPPPPPMDLECDGAEMETEDEYKSEELHAFQCFLAGLSELGYGFAYRVLDAQYVRTLSFPWAVPQRRRRVFVVGYLGDWRRAAAVLFDRESLQGRPPPRREAGKGVAPTLAARTKGGGGLGTDFDCDGGLIASVVAGSLNTAKGKTRPGDTVQCAMSGHLLAFGGNNTSGPIDVSPALNACASGSKRIDFESEAFVTFDCKGTQVQFSDKGEAPTLRSMAHANSHQNARGQLAVAMGHNGGPSMWSVRRLTPRECERLQGFPDDFTNVPWRGKEHSPDGRRYKALGNSMAVNVMRWIGDRIQLVETLDFPASS